MDTRFIDPPLAKFLRAQVTKRAKAALPVLSGGNYDGPSGTVEIAAPIETRKRVRKIESIQGWEIAHQNNGSGFWSAYLLADGTFANQFWSPLKYGGFRSVSGVERIKVKGLSYGRLIMVYTFLGGVLARKDE